MLSAIKAYAMARSKVSLHELSEHFQLSTDTLRPMLDVWINKGKLIKCSKALHCGVKCQKCHPEMIEWFEWVS